MPQVDQNVEIYQGADEYILIAVKDEDGLAVDLTTFDGLCWILSKGDSEVERFDLTDAELIIADADDTNDGLKVHLDKTVTADLDLGGLYRHQAWGTLSGDSRPLSVGIVTVLRGDGC
jgi:hypothetical protein